MNETRARFTALVERGLAPPREARARNAGITARYAGWYAARPDLFKWSGLAVLASLSVGRNLALRERPLMGWAADGIERLRITNNRVFADVGWAHAAFEARDGGLAAIERGLDGTAPALLAGFEDLERARRARRLEARERLVWRGNEAIFRYEQETHVQPELARIRGPFRALVSATARTDFGLLGEREGRRWFAWDMLCDEGALADIGDLAQRWRWLERRALPAWRAIERRSPAGRARLVALAGSAPPGSLSVARATRGRAS